MTSAVAGPAAVDYAACTADERAEAVTQLHALICATQAQLFAVLRAVVAAGDHVADGCRDLAGWLVARLGVSFATARDLADLAGALGDLPALAALLEQGSVSIDQLRPIARVATPESDAALAGELPGLSARQAEVLAARLRRVEPADEAAAWRRRHLRLSTRGQTTRLSGCLPVLEGEVVRQALERIAGTLGADPESGRFPAHDARLADALVALAGGRLAEDADPERATVVIHLDPEVLAGGEGGAETGSGAPLAAETARRAACDSRYQVLLRDLVTGRLDAGRTTRTIGASLARWLRRRDGGCRFPGCGRRLGVQGHHIHYWSRGGRTDRGNLVSLCRHCHRLCHEGGWRIEGDAEGELAFVSPTGRRLASRPAPLSEEVRRRIFCRDGPPPPAGGG